jgi:hypothetical protein
MAKTVKLSPVQLRTLIENVIDDVKSNKSKKQTLREKLELGRMGAEHGKLMSFDMWEAGAPTTDDDVVSHMRLQHGNEKKSEAAWAALYNKYEDAMRDPIF